MWNSDDVRMPPIAAKHLRGFPVLSAAA